MLLPERLDDFVGVGQSGLGCRCLCEELDLAVLGFARGRDGGDWPRLALEARCTYPL